MGQKTHPYGFRLNIVRTWMSKWYEDKHYARWLHEDLMLRKTIRERFANAGIAGVTIERAANKAKVVIFFKGREIVHKENGARLLERITAAVEEFAAVEQETKHEGRTLTMIFAPKNMVKK